MPLPSKVVGVYWTSWNAGIRLTSLPTEYNLAYLFAATKTGSEGSLQWNTPIGADIKSVRSRGCRVVLSTGGAGQGINFWGRDVSTRFVDSVVRINTELGGTLSTPVLDGVDFNTFEADATPNTPEYLWVFAELKRRFGSGFGITSPPAPWKDADKDMIRQALAQNLMDYAGPQYYDGPGLSDPAYIVSSVDAWVRDVAGGNASKIVVGFGMESLANYSTIEQITSAYKQIKAKHPGIRGAFLWQHKTDSDRGWSFAKQAGPLVGAASDATVPPPAGPAPTGSTYTVVAGDTYNDIAAKLGIDVNALMAANSGTAPEALQIGQVLQLPKSPTPPPSSTAPVLPALAKGSTDKESVRTLQSLLIARGATTVRVDGVFGAGTETALRSFQSNAGIPVSGKTDDATWRKLLRLR